jgi:hypothetical protein
MHLVCYQHIYLSSINSYILLYLLHHFSEPIPLFTQELNAVCYFVTEGVLYNVKRTLFFSMYYARYNAENIRNSQGKQIVHICVKYNNSMFSYWFFLFK